MDSRRTFVKKIGKGVVLSSLALSYGPEYASRLSHIRQGMEKHIRVGIIGAENSHSIEYGKIFNIGKKFPGVEVHYIWGETEEFAKNAMKELGIEAKIEKITDIGQIAMHGILSTPGLIINGKISRSNLIGVKVRS